MRSEAAQARRDAAFYADELAYSATRVERAEQNHSLVALRSTNKLLDSSTHSQFCAAAQELEAAARGPKKPLQAPAPRERLEPL